MRHCGGETVPWHDCCWALKPDRDESRDCLTNASPMPHGVLVPGTGCCPALGRHIRNSALLGRVPQPYPSQAALCYITLQDLPCGKEDIHIVLPPPQDAPPMEVPLINSWRNTGVVRLFFGLSASQNFPSSHEFNFETQNSQRRSRDAHKLSQKNKCPKAHTVCHTLWYMINSQAPHNHQKAQTITVLFWKFKNRFTKVKIAHAQSPKLQVALLK